MTNKALTVVSYLYLVAILTACASNPTNEIPVGIKVATESQVKECELVGDVHGTSMLYGVFVEGALSKARQQALQQAKSMNANTIVWLPFQTQTGATSVHGNAYICK